MHWFGNLCTCKLDTVAFSCDILSSRPYNSTVADVDEYIDLFDDEVKRILDIHAPLHGELKTRDWKRRDETSVIFVNENGEKRDNNKFVYENYNWKEKLQKLKRN